MIKFSREETQIIESCPEIQIGESIGWTHKIFTVFPAFRSRNYQLYFVGQVVSLAGTWLQIVAESWLVLTLTHSALAIGLVAAAATAPALFFSLFGGVIADRFAKRKILLLTQILSMLLAFLLGTLTVLHIVTVWEIALLAFLLGCVNAVDMPTRQAFIVEIVKREDLTSAIALNAGMFNGARVIGPSIAGVLIALFGVGGAFIINGMSYIAVIIALFFMKISLRANGKHLKTLAAIKAGVRYTWRHPVIRTLVFFTGTLSIFGWSYATMLPIIAHNTFHVGAAGLGYLYAASGLGAFVSAILVSAYSHKINNLVFIIGGGLLFTLGIMSFTFTTNFYYALLYLFISGVGLIATFSTANSTVQTLVEDQYRGRVMSIYTLAFLGLMPLGNLQIGYLSEFFGTNFAIRIGAFITLCATLLLLFYQKKIRSAFEQYKMQA